MLLGADVLSAGSLLVQLAEEVETAGMAEPESTKTFVDSRLILLKTYSKVANGCRPDFLQTEWVGDRHAWRNEPV